MTLPRTRMRRINAQATARVARINRSLTRNRFEQSLISQHNYKFLVRKGRKRAPPKAENGAKNGDGLRRNRLAEARRSSRICQFSIKKLYMNIKPKYFLYTRKSTEEDDRQVMSIEAQVFELKEFARKENLEILQEFQESKSAKTPGRPVFNEMMAKVEQMGNVGILAWHPDRLARNSIDGGRVIYAVDQKNIVSLRFPTFWFEPTPQGLFMLQVAFGQSKYYSDNLVENIKRGVRQKLRRGEWLNFAPFGFVNNPKVKNIEPHPTNSRLVVKAFEEYSKGTHTYRSLAQFLLDLGVVTRNGTPLPEASIAKMLSNRAYIGFVKHKGEWHNGSFTPIITPKLFEAVQRVLKVKERPRMTRKNYNFPYCGLFRCGECGSMITAQYAHGNGGTYIYYRCTKKKGKCSQRYVREDILNFQIKEQLKTISLRDEYTDWMLEQVDKWEKEGNLSSQSSVQNLADKIKESETRLDNLVSIYLDGNLPKELYIKRKDKIMRATLALKEEKKDFEHLGNNWVEPLREWILDTKQANFLSSRDDFCKTKELVQKIGTNHSVRDKSAHFGTPPPSVFVASRRRFLPHSPPSAEPSSVLSEREIYSCAGGRA